MGISVKDEIDSAVRFSTDRDSFFDRTGKIVNGIVTSADSNLYYTQSSMNDLPELTLIQQALRGDSTAFGELVLRNQTDVFNVCYRLTGDRQDAEDLAQEAFIRAHRKLHTFSTQFAFGPWMRKIAANLCLNELKKHYRKTEQIDPKDDEWRFASTTPGPAAAAEKRVQANVIREAILALPPTHRAVIELRHYQELSYQEIADTLGIPLDHVKSYLFRARKKLAGMLEDEK